MTETNDLSKLRRPADDGSSLYEAKAIGTLGAREFESRPACHLGGSPLRESDLLAARAQRQRRQTTVDPRTDQHPSDNRPKRVRPVLQFKHHAKTAGLGRTID